MKDFTLGCDPELVLAKNGEFVSAGRYFRFRDSFGCDGRNDTGEIRPGYCKSPVDLTAKIRKVLEYGHSIRPELEMLTGQYQFTNPLGGHIHFGINPNAEQGFCDIITNLDTVFTAWSALVDDPDQTKKRRDSGYGSAGDYREQFHGGFEYRYPGSFLLCPNVTLATLTLAKLTVLNSAQFNARLVKKGKNNFEFILSLDSYFDCPEDCKPGLEQINIITKRLQEKDLFLNWKANFLPNWGIGGYDV